MDRIRRALLAVLLTPSFCFAGKRAAPPPVEDRPEWLSGTSASYPRTEYILGVGQGSSQERAAGQARAEISKTFSLSIEARTEIFAREDTRGSVTDSAERMTDDVRTATARIIDGIEIARYWRDAQGSVYALAVLKREHSLKILKDKLEGFDRDFKDLSSDLRKTDGRFSRSRYALKLVGLARSRKRLNGDYRVLNPEGKGIAPPEELNDVLGEARKALSALTIQVLVIGDGAEPIALRVIYDLESMGLRAATRYEKAPDILVELLCAAAVLPPENLQRFWAKGSLQAKLSYGSAGEIFSRFEETGEETTRNPETALDATLRGLADKAAWRVYQAILSANLNDD